MSRRFQEDMTLKTHPGPFRAVWRGEKTAELRMNDMDFQVGDTIRLIEWNERDQSWTHPYREISIRVTHIADVNRWIKGIQAPWVMLSFKVLEKRVGARGPVCRGCRGSVTP